MKRCLHSSSGCRNEPDEDRTLCKPCFDAVIVTRAPSTGKATAPKGAKPRKNKT